MRQAILVTQAFHLPRALFTARQLGMDAVGLAVPPGVPKPMLCKLELREIVARPVAVLDTLILRSRPRYLGRREPLFGDEREDR
ncbi:MAG: YdcF family protein [Armatimonadetes bacterium]|nr:YdcF family protein [Armatimonadota bacterium]